MSDHPKVSSEKITRLLNRLTEGGSFNQVAKDVGTSKSFVFTILEEFPLWGQFMKRRESDSEH